jgi:hypothetical protein
MLHPVDWYTVTDVLNDPRSSNTTVKQFILAHLSLQSTIVTIGTIRVSIQNLFQQSADIGLRLNTR